MGEPAADPADELWDTAKVASLCGVSEATVRYWRHVRTGPPSARLGRHVRYRPDEVRAWIAQQFQKDPAGAA